MSSTMTGMASRQRDARDGAQAERTGGVGVWVGFDGRNGEVGERVLGKGEFLPCACAADVRHKQLLDNTFG